MKARRNINSGKMKTKNDESKEKINKLITKSSKSISYSCHNCNLYITTHKGNYKKHVSLCLEKTSGNQHINDNESATKTTDDGNNLETGIKRNLRMRKITDKDNRTQDLQSIQIKSVSKLKQEKTPSPSVAVTEIVTDETSKVQTQICQQENMSIVKELKCSKCQFSTTGSIHHLKIHEATHDSYRPFKCNQCNFSATQKGNLKTHQRIHTGIKPYKCNLCDYRATQASHLRRHESTHTGGEKPFKCPHCNFQAREKIHLKMHALIHTSIHPFKCRYCEYSANQAAAVRTHETSHTSSKTYNCEFCTFTSKKWIEVKLHAANEHKCKLMKPRIVCETAGVVSAKSPKTVLKEEVIFETPGVVSAKSSTMAVVPKMESSNEQSQDGDQMKSISNCKIEFSEFERNPDSTAVDVLAIREIDDVIFACDLCDFASKDSGECLAHAMEKHEYESQKIEQTLMM